MEYPQYIVYKGERFRLQTSGRYYQSGNKEASERLLHRRIWVDNFGSIPDGMHVHHINGDWSDNRIDNLDLVRAKSHQSAHMKERHKDLAYREKNKVDIAKAIEAAKKWHASEEGLAWHSEHGKRTWEGREPVIVTCSVCGKEYETYFPSRSRFCSHACEQKEGYQRHKTATGTCAYCGKEFVYNKYRKQECCSRSCSNKRRAEMSKSA